MQPTISVNRDDSVRRLHGIRRRRFLVGFHGAESTASCTLVTKYLKYIRIIEKKQGILWQSWEQTEVSVKDAVSTFSALFLEKHSSNDFIKTSSGCTNWLRHKILIKRYHYLPAEHVPKWLKGYTCTSVYMYMFINYVDTLTFLNSFICLFIFFYQYTPWWLLLLFHAPLYPSIY